MSGCLFSLAVLCYIIGFVVLLKTAPGDQQPQSGILPGKIGRPAFGVPPTSSTGAISPTPSGGEMLNKPMKFEWIQVGQRITTNHPVRGEIMAHVMGRVDYAELWQTRQSPQVPWTPTGNIFLGFWLEGNMFLLNWQTRVYLLEEMVELSDADIQRDFAPHARKFAQSDQTGDVYFAYPPAMWHIDDIGKFRVEGTEGEGVPFTRGIVGRFIHASGDGQRALVVEDYEGGGGQDVARIGYQIADETVKPA